MSPPAELHVSITNDLSEIGRLASVVEGFCAERGLGKETAHAINLSLDELLTNTISYGYEDAARHFIDIAVVAMGNQVAITIVDDARAFDPTEAAQPDLDAGLDDRPIGGLGIHFVRTMMDEVRYQHADGRNRLTLIKRTGP